MNAYERKMEILKLLSQEGKVSINSLAETFAVTRVTARADLDSLEKQGLLVRIHGGGVPPENYRLARMISKTLQERRQEKELIASLALGLIEDGSTLLIDSGSTTAILAQHLKERHLTVITNSVLVLQELSGLETVELLVSGGALRKPDLALIGEIASSFYQQIHADITFLGATGFSLDKGVSCSNLIEAETKKSMIKSGLKVCLLADSSKAGKVSLAHVCDWEDIDILVTDAVSPEDRKRLLEFGVEVLTP